MTDVLLATCAALPRGEPRGDLLVAALAERGVTAEWAVWDDPAVDWSAARLVAVRSTWDYDTRREELIGWARAVGAVTALVNPAEVLAWNTDKGYLLDLASSGLPVVPTRPAADREELARAVADMSPAVVKPRVGAGGRGVLLLDSVSGAHHGATPGRAPWVVQPLVETVRTSGETSVFVLGGAAVSQAHKLPAAGEIRVHEEYGGRTRAGPLEPEAAELALATVAAGEAVTGAGFAYARVDMMRAVDGSLLVSELEVAEPGLYLDVLPGNAASFADALADVVAGHRGWAK